MSSRAPYRWIAIAASFVNLGIHLALSPAHLIEQRYIGVLFVIGSGLLGLVMIGLSTDRDRVRTAAWLLGAVVSAVMFVSFVVSRTTGLPLGYHEAWAAAPEDLLGLASLALELVFLGCAAASLRVTRATRPVTATTHRFPVPVHDRTAPLT